MFCCSRTVCGCTDASRIQPLIPGHDWVSDPKTSIRYGGTERLALGLPVLSAYHYTDTIRVGRPRRDALRDRIGCDPFYPVCSRTGLRNAPCLLHCLDYPEDGGIQCGSIEPVISGSTGLNISAFNAPTLRSPVATGPIAVEVADDDRSMNRRTIAY